ncbi:MAG: hypothetical protein CL943_02525 [Candidatus Diapherotrites archaeon]|uniref:Uncharacterized protein n=1 Tax=Candidatus Iainarchaeum sp. TaxID=3101447 RepID=A0A2D6M157_9ARCH|nr:hypothetical protein [Candidatus Diapherotrites archaeon]|tara:strand:- start:4290 stop:4493 length:204 start_codon:yes stop_codon:yes gene_type:complete
MSKAQASAELLIILAVSGSIYTTTEDNTVTCTTGLNYQYDIKITYDVIGGISAKTFTGQKPTVGTCP